MGSNPTPRAYLRVLYKNNKSKGAKKFLSGDNLLDKKRSIPLTIDNSNSNAEKLDNQVIHDKIASITNNCSKNYFKKAHYSLAEKSPANAAVICDYLTREEIENNIKPSTKEGKLKTLVWLSNYFKDKLTFREMSKEDILEYLASLITFVWRMLLLYPVHPRERGQRLVKKFTQPLTFIT